jgi:hypothetical protein
VNDRAVPLDESRKSGLGRSIRSGDKLLQKPLVSPGSGRLRIEKTVDRAGCCRHRLCHASSSFQFWTAFQVSAVESGFPFQNFAKSVAGWSNPSGEILQEMERDRWNPIGVACGARTGVAWAVDELDGARQLPIDREGVGPSASEHRQRTTLQRRRIGEANCKQTRFGAHRSPAGPPAQSEPIRDRFDKIVTCRYLKRSTQQKLTSRWAS